MKVEKNYDEVIFDFRGHPKILFLSSIVQPPSVSSPYRRADIVLDFRELTTEEYDRVIVPKNDFLQNYFKREEDLFATQPSCWSAVP